MEKVRCNKRGVFDGEVSMRDVEYLMGGEEREISHNRVLDSEGGEGDVPKEIILREKREMCQRGVFGRSQSERAMCQVE